MSEEISKIVHTTTGEGLDICRKLVDFLHAASSPMVHCSGQLFKEWFTFQFELLLSRNNSVSSLECMANALMPLRPAEADMKITEQLIQIGCKALLDLEDRNIARKAKTIHLLWLVALIQILDEKLHKDASRDVISFYHREPDVLHRAAGHGPIIDWLEEVSKDVRRNQATSLSTFVPG